MKKFLSMILALCLVISTVVVMGIGTGVSVSAATQYANGTVEGGNMLHAMCWSYNTIRENLDDIKAAGYSAVQTSCIQPPKDYNPYDSTKGNVWWHFYQPIDFCVADGNNWLGTKAELTALCNEAHAKGISIIADVVVNHMAGDNHVVNSNVNATLINDITCWHNTGTSLSGSDRYDMVMHDNSGLPDLNTANSTVQSMVLAMLEEAIDCGVDGFRFDAAQNIETPRDNDSYKSMFWANTIGEANSYASSKGKTLFSYGEVYYDAWGGDNVLDDYIWYIGHVTEPNIGMEALGGVEGQDPSRVAAVNYKNNREAKNNVLWVESHDSYYSGTGYGGTRTNGIGNTNIVRAWAIIGSRANATGLYFARPGSEYVTNATNDTTWKSAAVAEVNKFKNYFRGKSEYLATSGKVAYNERGTGGVVISKLDGGGSVSLTKHAMNDGTYYDQITGNKFTVSNGKISGTVGSTGVAVVYNPSGAQDPTSATEAPGPTTGVTLTLKPGVWAQDGAWFAAYFYGNGEKWVKMSGSGSAYTVSVPQGYTKVIFCRMNGEDTVNMNWSNKWNQTGDLDVPSVNSTYTITGWGGDTSPGSWSVDPTTAPTSAPTAAPTTAPTSEPTVLPPSEPTDSPTVVPTDIPTDPPTASPTTAPTDPPVTTTAYYLVGSMTNWKPNADYNFYYDPNGNIQEYKLVVYLNANTQCKAVKSANGSTVDQWYPDGTAANITITTSGWYKFYLRPNGDGNSDWIASGNDPSKKVLYNKATTAPATEPPTTAPTAAPTKAPTAAPTEEPTVPPLVNYYILGDADGSGEVTILDATTIQRAIAGLTVTDSYIPIAADVNGKGLDILDATAIQRVIAGFDNAYGIGSIREYA